jgi:anthranilate phosphoribosyltransferase
MHDVVVTLLTGDGPVSEEMWESFWDGLLERGAVAERCEQAVALLATLTTDTPDDETVGALVASLEARREHPPLEDAVNIVGTGGGPSTLNVSTAASFVAATLGVRVVKSGSRAYTSRYGSVDVLELLGMPLAGSWDEVDDALERFGIAFTGRFVYPPELDLLARSILPVEMKRIGRFFNSIGPFLAATPASCQLTGVSDPGAVPLLRYLAARDRRRRVWLCFNRLGIDELVSFEDNFIARSDGSGDIRVTPPMLGLARGSLGDLHPAGDADETVRQFEALIAGDASRTAIDTVCLNAAALVVAGGVSSDWGAALDAARRSIARGEVSDLVERIRDHELDRLLR